MISLPDLAERLQATGIINKSFLDCTRAEIMQLVEAVFSCPNPDEIPPEGWVDPYLMEVPGDGLRLVVPITSHPSYHWWKPGSKSVGVILKEMHAPYEVAKVYIAGLTEDAWVKILAP